jgi:hypothetical protein
LNVKLAVLADYADTTSQGKLVICGLFDKLFAPQIPYTHPRMFLALQISAHPGEPSHHRITVRMVNPDGQPIIPEVRGEFDVGETSDNDPRGLQFVMGLEGVKFEMMGDHALDVFIDDRHEERVLLVVVSTPEHAGTS